MNTFETITHSAQETQELGKRISRSLKKGSIVALFGELGAGKTTIIQGIGWGLGLPQKTYINSPSFVLLKQYAGKFPIYHFDLYRLKDFEELKEIGYPDFFHNSGVVLIEWAERIEKYLEKCIRIEMKYLNLEKREIKVFH
ncbi:MAG: tRNA (adenosine(37)-N6)-threonylcarbamoyltransferase complex ATPase subunit type 1 TsaE [Candidatus Omnitrophica bacterium]|nr:tRNA (adenosine(37)-N6)-threonylcarbamoyltransferase complex ATPase subunit type 1 TsaE [Candidatus Omnitrophota bacterium]